MSKSNRQCILLLGLGFGDEGKGTMTDAFARQLAGERPVIVVRYNGGPQAAHNVVTSDAKHHTFSQFGSNMLIPGGITYLSRFMLISPEHMLNEAHHLQTLTHTDPFRRTLISPLCPVITPYHWAANCIREIARGPNRHGSCGMGIGEARQDEIDQIGILAWELKAQVNLSKKLDHIRDSRVQEMQKLYGAMDQSARQQALPYLEVFHNPHERQTFLARVREWCSRVTLETAGPCQPSSLASAQAKTDLPGMKLADLAKAHDMVFEGSQGVLLDEWLGFHPYTTWSNTTLDHAHTILDDIRYQGAVKRYGITRAYCTRHGAGPFPTQHPMGIPELHNALHPWQQEFKVGWFDLPLFKYALKAAGDLDGVIVTHMDHFVGNQPQQYCARYQMPAGMPAKVSDKLLPDGTLAFDSKHDLEHRECWTRALERVIPQYERLPSAELFNQENLSLPVVATSHGPLPEDKHFAVDLAEVCNNR